MSRESTLTADAGACYAALPLIVGVTGHRDLDQRECETLRPIVLEVLQRLQARVPRTPLVLLSSLAEGADRLVAEVAVELGIELVVPLPMPADEYERDFAGPASLATFRDLIARHRSFVVADVDFAANVDPRTAAYLRTGAYIAKNCQVLIAVWDGLESGERGGTSDVVRFKLEGQPGPDLDRNLFDRPETGPVVQVVRSKTGTPVVPGYREILPNTGGGDARSKAAFARMCHLTNTYNADARRNHAEIEDRRPTIEGHLLPQGARDQLAQGLQRLLVRFAAADALAKHFKVKTHRSLIILLAMGLVAGCWFQLHFILRTLFPHRVDVRNPWYMHELITLDRAGTIWIAWVDLPYILVIVALVVFYVWVRRRGYQAKFLDYRALAEGLRVQFFWALAGVRESAADAFLRKQKGELDWIRNALRATELLDLVPARQGANDGMDVVRTHWVESQLEFFVGRTPNATETRSQIRGSDSERDRIGAAMARRDDRKGRLFQAFGMILLGVGPAFALVRAFAPPYHGLVLILVAMTLSFVLLTVYARVMAFSEQAKQYGRMGFVFATAERRLAESLARGDVDQARRLLSELGKEALTENGDWLLLHRDRPLELPRT